MRINQLPIGARFEYEGQEYVKTGPMIGASNTGQRLIPKHAALKPLGEVAPPPAAAKSETVSRADVLRAFETFYARCDTLVADDQRAALESARDRFLKALGE